MDWTRTSTTLTFQVKLLPVDHVLDFLSTSSGRSETSRVTMSVRLFLVFLLVFQCQFSVETAKILGIFPAPSKSHYFLGKVLFEELIRRGHDVTMISPFENTTTQVYKGIQLDYSKFTTEEERNINFFTRTMSNPILSMLFLNYAGGKMLELALSQPEVLELLKPDVKFDAVIMDQFITDGFSYFAYHFNATNILLSTTAWSPRANFLVGNPASPSYVSELFMSFSGRMTFFQRLQNTLFFLFSYLNRVFYVFPQQNRILSEKLKNTPPLYDFLYNVSLVLLNGHESYADPAPFVPVMKNIGGFHVSKSGKLPVNLQKFMDDAANGVVYFSMGSNLKGRDLPIDVRDAILRVFSKLKTKILWKWEDDVLPGQPENVLLQKWFPQQEILAHPNLKLFITHGGLLSSIEAIYHGVPLLAIPVYGDQKNNAYSARIKGYAIDIPFFEFEEGKFENAINELLENSKYKENAVMRSKIFHDRPVEPLSEAVYWIEYVMRHKGAEHLRVAALNLSWYQYLLLDVFAFLLIVLISISYLLKALLKKCFKKNINKIKSS